MNRNGVGDCKLARRNILEFFVAQAIGADEYQRGAHYRSNSSLPRREVGDERTILEMDIAMGQLRVELACQTRRSVSDAVVARALSPFE